MSDPYFNSHINNEKISGLDQEALSRAYETLVILYNGLNQECQLSKQENTNLKKELSDLNKRLGAQSRRQSTTDGSSSEQLRNLKSKEILTDETRRDELLNNPSRLERDLKLLYDQCTMVNSQTTNQVLAANIINLTTHLLRMEKYGIILEDTVKVLENEILSFKKEINEKNVLIEQFKLCGLETTYKSAKSDNSNNVDVSIYQMDQVELLSHYLSIEKRKSEELSKEVASLNKQLEDMRLKEKELTLLNPNTECSLAEILKRQSEIFKDDFLQERRDRENAHARLAQLEQEMKTMIKKASLLQSIISSLNEENSTLKNELKTAISPKIATSQMKLNTENWACPTCTYGNESFQKICAACQTPRYKF